MDTKKEIMDRRLNLFKTEVSSFAPSLGLTVQDKMKYWRTINSFSSVSREHYVEYVRFLLSDERYMSSYSAITLHNDWDELPFGGDIAVKIASNFIKWNIYPYEVGMTSDPWDLHFNCPWDIASPYAARNYRDSICVLAYVDLALVYEAISNTHGLQFEEVEDHVDFEDASIIEADCCQTVPELGQVAVEPESLSIALELQTAKADYPDPPYEEIPAQIFIPTRLDFGVEAGGSIIGKWFSVEGLFSADCEFELRRFFFTGQSPEIGNLLFVGSDAEGYYELGKRRLLIHLCENLGWEGREKICGLLDDAPPQFFSPLPPWEHDVRFMFFLYGVITQLVDLPVAVIAAHSIGKLLKGCFSSDEEHALFLSVLKLCDIGVVHIIKRSAAISDLADLCSIDAINSFLQDLGHDPGGLATCLVGAHSCENGCCYDPYMSSVDCLLNTEIT